MPSHSFIYRTKWCAVTLFAVSVYCFKWLHRKKVHFPISTYVWVPAIPSDNLRKQEYLFVPMFHFRLGWITLSFQSNALKWCGVRLDVWFHFIIFKKTWFWHWAAITIDLFFGGHDAILSFSGALFSVDMASIDHIFTHVSPIITLLELHTHNTYNKFNGLDWSVCVGVRTESFFYIYIYVCP